MHQSTIMMMTNYQNHHVERRCCQHNRTAAKRMLLVTASVIVLAACGRVLDNIVSSRGDVSLRQNLFSFKNDDGFGRRLMTTDKLLKVCSYAQVQLCCSA